MKCEKCGTEYESGTECPRCGTPAPGLEGAYQKAESRQKQGKLLKAVIAAVVVIAAVTGGVIWVKKQHLMYVGSLKSVTGGLEEPERSQMVKLACESVIWGKFLPKYGYVNDNVEYYQGNEDVEYTGMLDPLISYSYYTVPLDETSQGILSASASEAGSITICRLDSGDLITEHYEWTGPFLKMVSGETRTDVFAYLDSLRDQGNGMVSTAETIVVAESGKIEPKSGSGRFCNLHVSLASEINEEGELVFNPQEITFTCTDYTDFRKYADTPNVLE